MRHVLTLFDLCTAEIEAIFSLARSLKKAYKTGTREPRFAGYVQALLFEKPSLRTRVSFETAFAHLGGTTMYLGADVGWGHRESPADFSRVLTQYVDVVICRARDHACVEQLAEHAACPVINGLTDLYHPCQALADLFTLAEVHHRLAGLKLAYVGDANNVARSLAVACARLSVKFAVAAPPAYQFDTAFLKRLQQQHPDLELHITTDPREAVQDADGVYTDVWVSMGQESERQQRVAALGPFQVNGKLMGAAPSRAAFMHCLPARRGEEVTDDVMDGPQSIVVQQAANRMHLQKGLLAWLLSQP
ncbi:MAG: ornithine carbamoyltransferase [Pirellulaceae bacterium]